MADDTLSRDPLKREVATKPVAAAPAARTFIHLRVHSAYSLLEGALQLGKIIGHAVKDEAPAIAVTDTNNLFGALEFAQKAVKDGIQPIIGCQIDLAFSGESSDGQRDRRRQGPEMRPVVLIAATEAGAIVYPPVPAFYAQPKSIEEMVDHTLGRVLDLFGVDLGLVRRWTGEKRRPKSAVTPRD